MDIVEARGAADMSSSARGAQSSSAGQSTVTAIESVVCEGVSQIARKREPSPVTSYE
jgi:hypothetical protein